MIKTAFFVASSKFASMTDCYLGCKIRRRGIDLYLSINLSFLRCRDAINPIMPIGSPKRARRNRMLLVLVSLRPDSFEPRNGPRETIRGNTMNSDSSDENGVEEKKGDP